MYIYKNNNEPFVVWTHACMHACINECKLRGQDFFTLAGSVLIIYFCVINVFNVLK